MSRKWTDDEIEYLRQNYATIPLKDLAARLQRNAKAISCRACMYGIRKYEKAAPNPCRNIDDSARSTDEKMMKVAFFVALEGAVEYRKRYKTRSAMNWDEFFCAVRKYANNIRIGS